MRISRGIGFAGVGAAMGAVVMIPAAASAGTTYNSTATATAGAVTVAGTNVPVPNNSVTATDQTGPQEASLGMSVLENAAGSAPGSLASALKNALPSGANLMTETATAASNGNSTACAGFLVGDCSNGKPRPITINLSLADLPGLNLPTGGPAAGPNNSKSTAKDGSGQSGSQSQNLQSGVSDAAGKAKSALGGAAKAVGLPAGTAGSTSGSDASASTNAPASSSTPSPLPLSDFAIVLTVSGPEAACTAGPPGSSGSNFTATQSLASASLDIQQGGKSVLPSGPIALKSGDVLSQIPSLPGASQLGAALQSALGSTPLSSAADPIDLTIDTGSTSGVGSGPKTTATAGELGLKVAGNPIVDVKGAQATCGPNNPAGGAAAPKPATKTTSSEKPMGGGIQTDEGRSGSDPALWAGVAGAAVLGGTASGLTLWRRRRHTL